MNTGRILVVDDDARMAQAVGGRLRDEGFEVACVTAGPEALAALQSMPPDIVLIEVWLPDQDGLAILQAVKQQRPEIDVIGMSEHGNIATAVKMMQLGARDYIEKPCSPDDVLVTVRRVLQQRQSTPQATPSASPLSPCAPVAMHGWSLGAPSLQPFMSRHDVHTQVQQTLKKSIVLHGQGLQSGLKTGLVLAPLPPDHGIVFRNLPTGCTIPATIDCVASTAFCTNLRQGAAVANTIEHLLSTLHAYGISNLLITLNDEVPIMDGSALAFCEHIAEAGIAVQDAVTECLQIDRCYHVGDPAAGAKYILIEPYDGFRITYRADYPPPIGVQEWTYDHHSGAGYCRDIAPARTFGFVKDVEVMHEAGLIPGGRLNNVILVADDQIVNTAPLRFENEFVRHKILDIMGDLYLLGMPIRGHVRANMTGHSDNVELVRTLADALKPV